MTQTQQVIEAMRSLGGYAKLRRLNQKVDFARLSGFPIRKKDTSEGRDAPSGTSAPTNPSSAVPH